MGQIRMSWMLAALLTLTMMQPVQGEATWYTAKPTAIMRSGRPFDRNALICAVDRHVFEEEVGKVHFVCTDEECIWCEVADSGNLGKNNVDLTAKLFRRLFTYIDIGRRNVTVWKST